MTTKKPKSHTAKKFGVAMSTAAAAAKLDIATDVVKAAKEAGCDAFDQSGRINCDLLLKFLANHPEIAEVGGKISKNYEQAVLIKTQRLIAEHRHKVLQGKMIPRAEVGQRLAQTIMKQKAILDDELNDPERVDRIIALWKPLADEWKNDK